MKNGIMAKSLALSVMASIALLACSPLSAGAADDLSDKDVRRYKVVYLEEKSKDSVKIRAETEEVIEYTSVMVKAELDGKQVYLLKRDEKNAHGDSFNWKIYLDPKQMGVVRIEKKTVSRSGQTVREEYINYKDPMFDYPDNLCHVFTITAALRAMDLKVGSKNEIYLMLGLDSAPWHMFIVVEDEETVTVPIGTIETYRIKLEPDYDDIMGKWSWTAPMIKRFVPDFYFWVEKQSPHSLVKFQGTFGPVGGSPKQAHELVEIIPRDDG